jgi:hypothetical protein
MSPEQRARQIDRDVIKAIRSRSDSRVKGTGRNRYRTRRVVYWDDTQGERRITHSFESSGGMKDRLSLLMLPNYAWRLIGVYDCHAQEGDVYEDVMQSFRELGLMEAEHA